MRGFEEPHIAAAAEDCGFGGTGAAGFGGSIGDDFSKGFSGALLAVSAAAIQQLCNVSNGRSLNRFSWSRASLVDSQSILQELGTGPLFCSTAHRQFGRPEETALDSADVWHAPPNGPVIISSSCL